MCGLEFKLITPIENAVPITPSDANDLTWKTRGLYVGTSGDVVVTFVGQKEGASITLVGLQPGIVHPFQIIRVWATGTTATAIVGMF